MTEKFLIGSRRGSIRNFSGNVPLNEIHVQFFSVPLDNIVIKLKWGVCSEKIT